MMPHMKGLIEVLLLNQTENSNFILKNIYEGASANFGPISAVVGLALGSHDINFIVKNMYEGASAYFELVLAIIHEIYALEI